MEVRMREKSVQKQAYTVFAGLYDGFMADIPYAQWADGLAECLNRYGIKDGNLLELGCGTGIFARLMAEKGYSVTGIDSSADMLRQANRKFRGSRLDIKFEQHDMRALETAARYGAVISVCDSMNYLRDIFDLELVFDGVAGVLADKGIFVFDMKTESFYAKLGDSVYTDENDAGRYVWENDYDAASRDNVYYMTFYIKSLFGLYRKYTEEHVQHAFTEDEVRSCAQSKRFRILEVCGEGIKEPADMDAQRVYYIM